MPTLQFKGKSFVQNHHLAVPYHELIPKPNSGLGENASLNDNLIIHGDNLVALKALLPTYAGRIKCIYIDPPYNTGNEGWVYNDNVKSPLIKEWIGEVVGKEGEDFTRHDKWLCMMLPRLKLLRELLAEDGSIFISIDDGESHHLRAIMDEVFGESNFLSQITWQRKKETSNDGNGFSAKGEYLIAYRRTEKFSLKRKTLSEKYVNAAYKNSENGRKWRPVPLTIDAGHQGGGYEYPIITPNGTVIERKWRLPEESFKELLALSLVYFGKNGGGIPQRKQFLDESEGIPPSNIWIDIATNKEGKKEILDIFGSEVFHTPKPTNLIKEILAISTDEDSIVLDSFAGSGTTAQSVLELNKDDGGTRKFILIECEDYADTLTAERVRRVMKGIPHSKSDSLKDGLGGSFSYFELGNALETESLLKGTNLPGYEELARYIFYTATGERFQSDSLSEDSHLIGSTQKSDIYLFYKPDLEYLKQTALTLEMARELRLKAGSKRLIVFAPTKYVEPDELERLQIDFCQLPFEIYKTEK